MGIDAGSAQILYDNWQNPSWRQFIKNHPDFSPTKAFDWWNSGGGDDKRPGTMPDVDAAALIAQNGWQPGQVTAPPGGNAPGAPEPGSLAADSDKAVRALDTWYQKFRSDNGGRHPTDQELTAAWGEYGMAARRYVDAAGSGIPKEDIFKALGDLAVKIPPSGSVGVAYALPPDLAKQKFDYQKDYDAKKLAADEAKAKADKAYQDAQIALSQGNQALAQAQLAEQQKQNQIANDAQKEANAIQLAGLTGTYNGLPTLAMQQFEQNKAQFQQTFGLQYEQFQAQKEQWATENGFTEAQVTGMFKGNPTLAMQTFLENKDQFAKTFAVTEAGVTGVYKGAPTLAAINSAMDRAIAQGNITGKFVDPQTGQSYETLAAQAQTFNQGIAAGQLTGVYNGAPTEQARQFNITAQQRQDQLTYDALRQGNRLQALQALRGPGAPFQNYAGMPRADGSVAPGYTPSGASGGTPRFTQPQGGPVVDGQGNMAPGYEAPPMPANLAAIVSGAPLPQFSANVAPGYNPQLRAAGAQAQANEGSWNKAGRYEAYEMAGRAGDELAETEQRIRSNLGSGLAPAGYKATTRFG